MEQEFNSNLTNLRDRGWLIWLAAVVTILWLLGGFAYIIHLGVHTFVEQSSDEIGGFLEGFFAPLAFLWLVIGLFIQQRELAQNTAVLKATNENSEQQTRILEATELRTRQNTFFQIAESVRRQTGNLCGLILTDLDTDHAEPLLSADELSSLWKSHQQGQYEIFPAMFLNPESPTSSLSYGFEALFGNDLRKGTTEEYMVSFRELLILARESDPNGTLVRTTYQTPHGTLYRKMLELMPPTSSWVFTDRSQPFKATVASYSAVGHWQVEVEGLTVVDTWRLKIQESESGLSGQLSNSEGSIDLTDVHVTNGEILFIRFNIYNSLFVITANLGNDGFEGMVDQPEGIYGSFKAERI